MKAIRVKHHGESTELKLEEISQPEPKADEALIRLKTIGINYIDIYMRTGRYASNLPYTPGLEGAGVVEGVGANVTEVKPGDRVAYTGQLGSYAEFAVVKAAQLIPIPDDISFEQAAALPLQGLTAHYLVHDFYYVKPGDTILVHAAAGGVGLLLVQMLKHMGARVIGTVSTEEKAKIAKEAGAHDIIIYTKQEFVTEVKNLTEGKGVDYILDGVGKDTFTKNLEAVRARGCISLFGSASGPAEPLAPNSLQAKSLTVCGGRLSNHISNRIELLKRAQDLLLGIKEGWLRLKIDHILNLDRAAEAHSLLENRKTSGKLVLTVE